jgi:hypothetical protein
MTDRLRIDPDARYGGEGLTRVESNALGLMRVLQVSRTERTRDAFELHLGDQEARGVVLIVTAEALELRLPTVEWTRGAYGPASTSRLWKRVTWRDDLTPERVRQLVDAAIAKRRAEFKPCRYCGREVPPEHRLGKVCHGCAERHEGVVH